MTDQARKSSQICKVLDLIGSIASSGTHSKPALAILGLDFLAIANPVTIPPPDSGGVMDTNGVDTSW